MKQGVGRVIGAVTPALKRIGQIGMGVGRFIRDHHQPLSMALMGAAEATGSERFKNIAGLGLMGSAALTAAGVGRDYGFYNQNPT